MTVTPFTVTPNDSGDVQDIRGTMAYLPDGNIVVAYEHDSSPSTVSNPDNSIGIRVIQPDGTPVTGEFFDNFGDANTEVFPQVLALDATHFAVIVSDFDAQVELQARIYTISGGDHHRR